MKYLIIYLLTILGTVTIFSQNSDLFTNRDLNQTYDKTNAKYIRVASNSETNITEAGVYVLSGTATDTSIIVETDNDSKVQIVLNNLHITNSDKPAIYVKSADKVFITTTNTENTLEVSNEFSKDGDKKFNAVIFSRDDLVLNGVGNLSIDSAYGNGITSKDDLKITGGTYYITTEKDSLEANDSIRILDGDFTIRSGKDGLHSEYDEDDSVGFVYIGGGSFNITAEDDGIQGITYVQIDGGNIKINNSTEGIEATTIIINGGVIDLYASDDGINASRKSNSYNMLIEVNDGDITVEVGPGDTDAFDSNGNIVVNGGVINVTGQSAFDADGSRTLNGGTVTVNNEVVTVLEGGFPGWGNRRRR